MLIAFIHVGFMLRFSCVGFLGLMDSAEGMESRTEHLLLCLSPTLVHCLDGIEVGTVDDFAPVFFHPHIIWSDKERIWVIGHM